jgi:CIC family chloride channel protein
VKHALPADRKVEMIPEEMRLDKVIDLVVRSDQIDFPVVDKEMRLTGILSLTDVKKVMLDEEMHLVMVARDIATDDVLTVTPEDSLHTALKKMTAAEVRELPVVSTEDPRRVISMVSRKDLIRVYHDENEKATRNRVADSFM